MVHLYHIGNRIDLSMSTIIALTADTDKISLLKSQSYLKS